MFTANEENAVHLVTGATGLIGTQLVRGLRSQGSTVRALVRATSDVSPLVELGAEIVTGDICNRSDVARAVAGSSHIYHCAGLVTDWAPREAFDRINVEGTRNLVDAAIATQPTRFVHLSSAAVYGYPGSGLIDESAALASRGIPYIQSKIMAEKVVQGAVAEHRLAAAMLRPVMVFGPRCTNYVGEVVRLLRRGQMRLLDGGRHIAGLAFVDNVVDAILLAARHPRAVGNVFNVSDDSAITWKQYVYALADGIGVDRPRRSLATPIALYLAGAMEVAASILHAKQRPLLTRLAVLELGRDQRYDISRARRILGFEPRTAFQQSILTTIHWVNSDT